MKLESTTTTQLLLVRHGQTTMNVSGAFCGLSEAPLTEVGREQAQRLANRLSHEHIDALYCSPQGRARETAQPVAAALQLDIQIREALHEIDFGRWEGLVKAEIEQKFPWEIAAWNRGSWAVQAPGGETQQAVLARVVPCLVELLAAHAGQTILIVSHGTTLRLLVGHLLNLSLPASRALRLDTASLTKLLVRGDHVQLAFYNDTSHHSPA